jgi:hypothetical protein
MNDRQNVVFGDQYLDKPLMRAAEDLRAMLADVLPEHAHAEDLVDYIRGIREEFGLRSAWAELYLITTDEDTIEDTEGNVIYRAGDHMLTDRSWLAFHTTTMLA